jgi:acetyltransferase
MTELFDFIKIFNNNSSLPAKRLAVITNAGGPGVVAIDTLINEGLELAKLSPETGVALSQTLPVAANVHNPIDILGDALANRYQAALEIVLLDSGVDAVLVILTPQSMTEIAATAQVIIAARKKFNKPVVAVFMGEEMVADSLKNLNESGVAAYSFPEAAIKSLRVLNDFYYNSGLANWQASPRFEDVDYKKVAAIFAAAYAKGQNSFPEAEALEILSAYKLPTLMGRVAHNPIEAQEIAEMIGKKMVLKIVSPDILHKSDVGGVMLNVDPLDAASKFTELLEQVATNKPGAKLDGVLLTEMLVAPGVEMILGGVKDPSLGSTIMLGLGGIYVEVFKDVVFGLNPLNHADVRKMIKELKSAKLLKGLRGAAPSDEEALVESVLRLAQLLSDFPEIAELDINPLLVLPAGQGTKVLDARIRIV